VNEDLPPEDIEVQPISSSELPPPTSGRARHLAVASVVLGLSGVACLAVVALAYLSSAARLPPAVFVWPFAFPLGLGAVMTSWLGHAEARANESVSEIGGIAAIGSVSGWIALGIGAVPCLFAGLVFTSMLSIHFLGPLHG